MNPKWLAENRQRTTLAQSHRQFAASLAPMSLSRRCLASAWRRAAAAASTAGRADVARAGLLDVRGAAGRNGSVHRWTQVSCS